MVNQLDIINIYRTVHTKALDYYWDKEGSNKWEDIHCSLVKILNIFKMSILFKLIHRFNTTIKETNSRYFLVQIDKKVPKCIWECRNPGMIKITLIKKIKVGSLNLLYVKSCYKVIEIEIMWYCQYDII